jgi:hypothetical protein
LEKLAEQMAQNQLSPEERAELEALLKKLAQRLTGNAAAQNLTHQLAELQTQAVSPEMLRKIARSLLELDQKTKNVAQLEQLLEQIKASRKNIGLAGLEMERKTGGIANSEGGPGEESGTGEAQGTQVGSQSNPEEMASELKLTGIESDAQSFSKVYMQEAPSGEGEPTYMTYRQVYLHAKQAYAEAVNRNEVPVRYRQQIKDYLQAIANPSK